jgi:hypothetical protein
MHLPEREHQGFELVRIALSVEREQECLAELAHAKRVLIAAQAMGCRQQS